MVQIYKINQNNYFNFDFFDYGCISEIIFSLTAFTIYLKENYLSLNNCYTINQNHEIILNLMFLLPFILLTF